MNSIEQEIIKGGNYTTQPNGVAMEKTTFWFDFSVAEKISGAAGVRDTFKRAFEEWKDDIRYLTALYCVMNWKGGQWYEKNKELSDLYYEKQLELDKYILASEKPGTEQEKFINFNEEEIVYFYRATD